MTPAAWVDTGVTPPARLPDGTDAALEYLGAALGHPVYVRWTIARLKRGAASLADARRDHPAIFALLLEHETVIEYWDRGRLRAAPEADAPSAPTLLTRLLRQHGRRFRQLADVAPAPSAAPGDPHPDGAWLAALAQGVPGEVESPLLTWLARRGRFANRSAATNALGVADDGQALRLFLRDRAGRSPHTLRAYVAELRRLIHWCRDHGLGPLSDLTRDDLLAFRHSLTAPRAWVGSAPAEGAPRARRPGQRLPMPREATRVRALAVISSLFHYWQKTGYLVVNPAAGLSGGSAARATWTPGRILPAPVLALCDAVIAAGCPDGLPLLRWLRRCALWSLYRYAGVRLAELEWSDERHLPRIDVDLAGAWTLHVLGKGNRRRAIPLPAVCVGPLRAYRVARGLPPDPAPFEPVPPVHSERGRALGHSGLYDEIRAVFEAAQARIAPGDTATLALLRAASTHWLRHGYARTLVVDHAVPLPVAQALLGHASVQTTAAYARTDLTQMREFVEGSFPPV